MGIFDLTDLAPIDFSGVWVQHMNFFAIDWTPLHIMYLMRDVPYIVGQFFLKNCAGVFFFSFYFFFANE